MKVRFVIPHMPARAADSHPETPLSCELRAWLTPGPIPKQYVEIVPDKRGGLKTKEAENAQDKSVAEGGG